MYIKNFMKTLGTKTSYGSCTELFEINDSKELEPILNSVSEYIKETSEYVSRREMDFKILQHDLAYALRENDLLRDYNSTLCIKIESNGDCQRCKNEIPKEDKYTMYCSDCLERIWTRKILERSK